VSQDNFLATHICDKTCCWWTSKPASSVVCPRGGYRAARRASGDNLAHGTL